MPPALDFGEAMPAQAFREADGDYRREKDMEGEPPPPLFQHQNSLPRLPVPRLEDTCSKFLRSIVPLVSADQLQRAENAVREFLRPGGMGEVLQERLIRRAEEKGDSSWLAEWWNKAAYLLVPGPTVVFVSYFFTFADARLRADRCQAGRAAVLLRSALQFRAHVASGQLPPERVGRGNKAVPLCSVAYKYMFNACRLPRHGGDVVRLYPPAAHNHVAVIHRNRFYIMDGAGPNGQPLSRQDLQAQLEAILEVGRAAGGAEEAARPVGALTTMDREDWAAARARLLADGNGPLLAKVESAAMVVCLDEASPVTRTELSRGLWHGDGRNRYFDKPVQLVVYANGKAGVIGEHSLMDGMPTMRLVAYMLESTMLLGEKKPSAPAGVPAGDEQLQAVPRPLTSVSPPCPLDLALSPASLRAIARAETAFDALVDDHDMEALAFTAYGSSTIKSFKLSPDAFVQMAIQLAYFNFFGKFRATYEPAQTRRFLHGRTAVVRACSPESAAWVAEMTTGDRVPTARKLQLLTEACSAHIKRAVNAANGKDIDRHLFGLANLLQPGETSALFQDPSYLETKTWGISTSALSHDLVEAFGWGEVVPDGVGVAYMTKSRRILFNVASRRWPSGGWPKGLCHHLHEALISMRELCEDQQQGRGDSVAAAAKGGVARPRL